MDGGRRQPLNPSMGSYSEFKGVLNSVRLRTPNGGLITEQG
jgi:hypothetical protein